MVTIYECKKLYHFGSKKLIIVIMYLNLHVSYIGLFVE